MKTDAASHNWRENEAAWAFWGGFLGFFLLPIMLRAAGAIPLWFAVVLDVVVVLGAGLFALAGAYNRRSWRSDS